MYSTNLKIQVNNKGKLIGKIYEDVKNKFEVEGEVFYEGFLSANRLSDAVDIIPFTISEKLLKAYDLTLTKDTEIAFGGELRSYNRIIDGKSRLILSFFVKEILQDCENENQTNELSLIGYVCKEPIYRKTPFEREICDILIAVNRPNFNKSDYIPCIIWGRNARLMQNQKVGTKVNLFGRIQSRTYKKEISEGVFEERTAYEVSCQRLSIEETNKEISPEEVGAYYKKR